MQYIKVKWLHQFANEPVMLYSELNDDRWEQRKVEVFQDGRTGLAGHSGATGTTMLGVEPIPRLEVIAADRQFEVEEITANQFELVWQSALSTYR